MKRFTPTPLPSPGRAALSVLSAWIPLAAGCNAFMGAGGGDQPGSAGLKAFQSESEFNDYVTGQINSGTIGRRLGMNDLAVSAMDSSAPAGQPMPGRAETTTGDFSRTTVQEAGVDEADVVKTDGTFLYIMDNRPGSDERSADPLTGEAATVAGLLRIVRVQPHEQTAVVSQVPIAGHGRDIYLLDSRIIALSETGGRFYILDGPAVAVVTDVQPDSPTRRVEPEIFPPPEIQPPRVLVTVIDVADPVVPRVLNRTSFDGSISSSRLIDGVLHLVLSLYPAYAVPMITMGGGHVDVMQADAVDPATTLPRFTQRKANGDTREGTALSWQELYHPSAPDGLGMVYVASIDMDNDASFSTVGILARPGLVYSSRESLYLTDAQYNFNGTMRESTDIYKFSYTDRAAKAVASGTVPGRVLNQYSMGEHQGFLRVASSTRARFGFFNNERGSSNDVYVLKQDGETLTTVGRLEGIEPGERIQSARFVADRGFLVTFRETDPFFTLDMNDPKNPRIVGKLEIPGFSTFLQPVDKDHILAVGQYVPPPGSIGPRGVQVSVFDVSNFAKPTRMSNVVVGRDTGATSEAMWNPKALSYVPSSGLMAIPVSIEDHYAFADGERRIGLAEPREFVEESEDADAPIAVDSLFDDAVIVNSGFDGLIVYRVSIDEGLDEIGRLSSRPDSPTGGWSSFTRGVFINDEIFAVTRQGVRGASVKDMAHPTSKVTFTE